MSLTSGNTFVKRWLASQREEQLMEYFRLQHPVGKVILCDESVCEEIADYLELDEEEHERFVCANHTSSDKHASVLLRRTPSGGYPYRSRHAA
jgi:hypothetical protein